MNERTTLPNAAIAAAFFLLFAVCLCWPIFYTGQYFIFADTQSYLRGGEKIWDVFFQLLPATPADPQAASQAGGAAAPEALTVNDEGRNTAGRSFPYSAFASMVFQIGGPLAVAFAQAVLTTVMICFLITREARQSPYVLVIGAALIAALSGLPFYASYLMPDVFGGLVILFGVLLVRDIDRFGNWALLLLLALSGFSAAAHYGNIPLMFGIVMVALGVRLLRGRLGWKPLILGLIAISVAPLTNLGASSAVLNDPSVTPQRLPIILARSLNDGPGLWYLRDVCPEADLALCEIYGDSFSSDTYWFLWSDEGVLSLPKDQFDRVRSEEWKVVLGAFMSYPVEQSKSLFSNIAFQVVRVGVSQIYVADGFVEDYAPIDVEAGPTVDFLGTFDRIIPLATLASVILIAGVGLFAGMSSRWIDMFVVLGLGLLGNAFIFGGLSYSVDRYQGRIAWVIPVMAFLFLAETMARRRTAASGLQAA